MPINPYLEDAAANPYLEDAAPAVSIEMRDKSALMAAGNPPILTSQPTESLSGGAVEGKMTMADFLSRPWMGAGSAIQDLTPKELAGLAHPEIASGIQKVGHAIESFTNPQNVLLLATAGGVGKLAANYGWPAVQWALRRALPAYFAGTSVEGFKDKVAELETTLSKPPEERQPGELGGEIGGMSADAALALGLGHATVKPTSVSPFDNPALVSARSRVAKEFSRENVLAANLQEQARAKVNPYMEVPSTEPQSTIDLKEQLNVIEDSLRHLPLVEQSQARSQIQAIRQQLQAAEIPGRGTLPEPPSEPTGGIPVEPKPTQPQGGPDALQIISPEKIPLEKPPGDSAAVVEGISAPEKAALPQEQPKPDVQEKKVESFPQVAAKIETAVAKAPQQPAAAVGVEPKSVGPGAASPEELAGMEKVSIAKERVNERRATEGNLPVLDNNPLTNQAAYNEAEKRIEADPDYPDKLIDELRQGQKTSVDVYEQAALAHKAVTLRNAREAAAERSADPNFSEEERIAAHAEYIALNDRLNELDQATKLTGESAARVMQWRQRQIAMDWTLAGIERRAKAAKGRPLDEAELAKAKAQAEQIEVLNKRIQELKTQAAERSRGLAGVSVGKSAAGEASKGEAEARRSGAEVDIGKERERIVNGMKTRLAEGDAITDLYDYVQKLHLNLQREAIRDTGKPMPRNEVIDRVHAILTKEVGLDLPRKFTGVEGTANTEDLVSGIGRQTPLTTDPSRLAKMEIRTQVQKVGKINRFLQKLSAPFTGQRRPPTSAESRQLEKQGRELARENGVQITDPAKQLATSLESKKTRLRNEIAELDRAIALREPMVTKQGIPIQDAEIDRLTEQRNARKTEYTEIFGDPQASPEAMLKRATAVALRNEKEWSDRLARAKQGVFGKEKAKTPPISSPALDAIKARVDAAKSEVEELYDLANPKKTPEQIALQSQKTRLLNEIAKNTDKIARGDFSKPVRVPKYAPDDELNRARATNEKLKQEIGRGYEREADAARPWWQKAMEQISGASMASALSGYHTLIKLAGFSGGKFIETPLSEMGGGVTGQIPGLRTIFERANLESGHTVGALAKYYSGMYNRGLRAAWDYLRRGESESRLLYGKPDYAPPKWYNFFGRHLHAGEKAVAFTGAEEMYRHRAIASALKDGLDPNNEFVRAKINKEAYDYSQRHILMEENRVAQSINGLMERLRKNPNNKAADIVGSALATLFETLLTKRIVRVPLNYVSQTIARTPLGLVGGLIKAGVAGSRGLINLKPVEANIIASLIKTGQIGSAVFVLGMIDATRPEDERLFGGYWQPGRKRGGEDAAWGSIRFGGTTSKILTHIPLLESGQMGNTLMRVILSKRKGESPGVVEAAIKAGVGLAGKAPIVSPVMRLTSDRPNVTGQIVQGLVPQILQNIAVDLDKDKTGETIGRTPRNATESMETGIPGLRENVPPSKLQKRK